MACFTGTGIEGANDCLRAVGKEVARTLATSRIQSVDRAFLLLAQLAESRAGTSLPLIAERSGLCVATAHRLLATLESIGAVIRTGPGGYRIGMSIHDLTRGSCPEDLLTAAAQPVLRRLGERSGLTVHVGVLSPDLMVTYVAKHQQPRTLSIQTRIGTQLEAYCSGLGKVLLAALPIEQQHSYLADAPFVSLTANTVVDPARLEAELHEVAARGYAIDDCELYDGLRCVAVPIYGADGCVLAALSCSGPSQSIIREQIPQMAALLEKAAEEIRRKLFPAAAARIQ